MKVYRNKHEAVLNEGIIQGVDESEYDSLEEAKIAIETAGWDQEDSECFGYYDGDKIKIAWN
jgi:hypothetical protein